MNRPLRLPGRIALPARSCRKAFSDGIAMLASLRRGRAAGAVPGAARIAVFAFAGLVLSSGFHGNALAQGIETPAHVRALAEAGAQVLALRRIDALQPAAPGAAGWFEWERLRLESLQARGQDQKLLARVRAYPEDLLTRREAQPLLVPAAIAAVRAGAPEQARRWLRQWFASAALEPPNAVSVQYRRARRGVIEALVAEREAEAAYRSMLRFQQDFGPLTADDAEGFVAGLLRLDRNSEAAQWLAQLGPASHYATWLRMRAGLVSPDAAAEQARAALARSIDRAALDLLEAVARAQDDRPMLAEAAELRLDMAWPLEREGLESATSALWRTYDGAATAVANQSQLLVGDDAAWLAHAERIRTQRAVASRSLLARLALHAAEEPIRVQAQTRLLAGLKDARLDRVAVMLFSAEERVRRERLSPQVRHILGELNAGLGRPEEALAYWQGLGPPSGSTAEQWGVQRLAPLVETGRRADVQAVLEELFRVQGGLSREARHRLFEAGRAAVDRAEFQIAEDILRRLRTGAAGPERAAVSRALAQIFEATGRSGEAAAAYLDAALASGSPTSDRESLQARAAAARNLARGGLQEDARGILAWLVRHAKDAAVADAARRELAIIDRPVSSSAGR